MKFQICHESRARMRVKLLPVSPLSPHVADALEAWLNNQKSCVAHAAVLERTNSIIIRYKPNTRQSLIQLLAQTSLSAIARDAAHHAHSPRLINREYEEKLVGAVAGRILRSLFLPKSIATALTCLRSVHYIKQALLCLCRGKLHVELLDGLSICLSLLRRDFSTASAVMFLLHIGEILDDWTHKKSIADLAQSMALHVQNVWLCSPSGEDIEVPLTNIPDDAVIRLRMGAIIPLDGEVIDGEIMVNQAALTGESMPVEKRPGTALYAGTVVENGSCTMKVTQKSGDSKYDRIIQMIEASEHLKSTTENKAAALANHLVPYTLLGCALTFLLTRNVSRALSVLMVDFSCALKLAMPLSVLSAMREAAVHKITVKGGKFMEDIARADTIVFDKTGTLTHATPTVVDIIPFGNHDPDEMLRIAACLEEHFPHSMANAVVRAAVNKSLQHEEMHSTVDYIVAHGIVSTLNEQRVIIGSAHFVFEDEHCTIPENEIQKFDNIPVQYSHLYMAIAGKLAAVICIADPLRQEAADVIRQLHQLGISHTVMLTGDSEKTAAAVAKEVGVDEYHSEVLPEDKAHYVENERKKGHSVIMIGDGINDAPALSAASVGIAICDGAAIAREIADVTIAAESLHELVVLRTLSSQLMQRIDLNYRFVIGFNGALIALGAAGILPPAITAMCHNVSTIGVSLHSMTPLI